MPSKTQFCFPGPCTSAEQSHDDHTTSAADQMEGWQAYSLFRAGCGPKSTHHLRCAPAPFGLHRQHRLKTRRQCPKTMVPRSGQAST